MASLVEVEHGRCSCGGHFENHEVEIRLTASGRPIVLPNVPQGVCPRCGSHVYKVQVLEYVESLMRERPIPGPN